MRLDHLKLQLGPDLRAVFPVVLNVIISGEIDVTGPADPALMTPSGVLKLEGGVLNLVATQFMLDRNHPNRLVFLPEQGLDPTLDLSLASSDLRTLIQVRRSVDRGIYFSFWFALVAIAQFWVPWHSPL